MIRKTLGLCLALATFAAFVPGAAVATEPPDFRVSKAPAILTGPLLGKEHHIVTSAGTVECTGGSWSGGAAVAVGQTISLTPSYTGCSLNKEAATVTTSSCEFIWTLNEGSSPPTATANLFCPVIPNSITIKTAKCTIHIPDGQKGLAHATFTNSPLPGDVDMDVHLHAIEYTATVGCPGSHAAQTNGELIDEVTVEAHTVDKDPLTFEVE